MCMFSLHPIAGTASSHKASEITNRTNSQMAIRQSLTAGIKPAPIKYVGKGPKEDLLICLPFQIDRFWTIVAYVPPRLAMRTIDIRVQV